MHGEPHVVSESVTPIWRLLLAWLRLPVNICLYHGSSPLSTVRLSTLPFLAWPFLTFGTFSSRPSCPSQSISPHIDKLINLACTCGPLGLCVQLPRAGRRRRGARKGCLTVALTMSQPCVPLCHCLHARPSACLPCPRSCGQLIAFPSFSSSLHWCHISTPGNHRWL